MQLYGWDLTNLGINTQVWVSKCLNFVLKETMPCSYYYWHVETYIKSFISASPQFLKSATV